MVQEWQHYQQHPDLEPARVISENLKQIKDLTIKWTREKRRIEGEELKRIELEISQINASYMPGYISSETKEHLITLEASRRKLLQQKEADWRLKSRAIWLQAGDENTKFF